MMIATRNRKSKIVIKGLHSGPASQRAQHTNPTGLQGSQLLTDRQRRRGERKEGRGGGGGEKNYLITIFYRCSAGARRKWMRFKLFTGSNECELYEASNIKVFSEYVQRASCAPAPRTLTVRMHVIMTDGN